MSNVIAPFQAALPTGRAARPVRPALFGLLLAVSPLAATEAQASRVPPVADQVSAAVLPLPEDMRAAASVMGYRTAGKLEMLRAGTNGMRCLADDPADKRFHVACYHDGMEPFMARGRALRAAGVTGTAVDSVRYAEVESGKIPMPKSAALYQMTGPENDYDPVAKKAREAKPLYVIYIPGATVASTGLSTLPQVGSPWLMFPGTPKAHIMFTPGM
jgi:hypothetical protein